jgi:hypothetical protein
MAGSFSFYDANDDIINQSNKISFGELQIGVISQTIPVWVWNDRDDLVGADDSDFPQIFAIKSGDDDIDILFDGTQINEYKSMLEARSCGSINTIADMVLEWTPIGPMDHLTVGSMPVNSARLIELRVNPPFDSQLFDLSDFTLRVFG